MKKAAKENLEQLYDLLLKIPEETYKAKPEVLYGSSVGQHMRHILEFYLLMISGSIEGVISYDRRQRDLRIENQTAYAAQIISKIMKSLDLLREDDPVLFEADYTSDESGRNIIKSSVGRELAYCIEHSIHHQALIKAGLIVMGMSGLADEDFGVAYSTIRYRDKESVSKRVSG
ncbi:MAG: DinB family protein [Bacteroidales bacterium]|nr:DinB family protein [Bacteroidales bacterium]